MATPEGTFQAEVNLDYPVTTKHTIMLGVAINTLLDAHNYPDTLQMTVNGTSGRRRYFSGFGLLAPKGIAPKLAITREEDTYSFHSSLVDPSRSTSATIINHVDAKFRLVGSIEITKAERTFIPRPDINGIYFVQRPGSHELRASSAIGSVARSTDRLSREFSAVQWKTYRAS